MMPFRERSLVAIRSRREEALGCGHNGEQHEQGRSRQSPPTQEWEKRRKKRKHRPRNKDGEISGKHGNPPVRTLRKLYGQGFAAGYPETAQLSEVMLQLNEA